MLLQHTIYYFLARGLPGLVNFLGLSVYTHLLAPQEYGQYALALATVSLTSAVMFQWIQMGLLRFLPRYAGNEERLLSTVLAAYLMLVAATGLGGVVGYAFVPPGPWRDLVLPALALLWVQTWFEINQQLLSSHLLPLRYGAMAGSRAVVALACGGAMAWAGWQAHAPLWGFVAGGIVGIACFAGNSWHAVRYRHVDRELLGELACYGMPLGATFVFSFVISTSDRYLIAWLLDEQAVGLYSASYDLAQNSLGVLMVMVNLAAYPLIVRALEHHGVAAARAQLKRQLLLLWLIAAPATVGFVLVAHNIAVVLLGSQFRAGAVVVLPWIAMAALVGGMKAYYCDLAFQLGRQTMGQVRIVMVSSLVNLLLNLVWLPHFGLQGAVWATLVAYLLGLVLSVTMGRRHFSLPGVHADEIKVTAAVVLMAVALWPARSLQGAPALVAQMALGAAAYGAGLLVFNPAGCRPLVIRWVRGLAARRRSDRDHR